MYRMETKPNKEMALLRGAKASEDIQRSLGEIDSKIEHLIRMLQECRRHQDPDPETREWYSSIVERESE